MINTWSVDDFLKQYSSINTLQVYRSTFREYFRFTYSELQNLPLLTLDRRITVYSVQYFDENRDYRNDLLKYKKHISHKAPKTITTKIACLIRYFEDNYIKFTKSFTRNLYGRGSAETVSEEYVPNNNDIARIIEYMPIQAKTVTLVLASSGMRIGEALLLELDDI